MVIYQNSTGPLRQISVECLVETSLNYHLLCENKIPVPINTLDYTMVEPPLSKLMPIKED